MATEDQLDPGARAGLRLALLLGTALLWLAVVVPLAIAVRGDSGVVVDLDRDLTRAADDLVSGRPWLVDLLGLVTDLGDPLLLSGLTVVGAVLLTRAGLRRLALLLVLSRLGAMVLSTSIKLLVDRVRPLFDVPVATALGPSFPSGHSLGAAAFWTAAALTVLPLLGRRARTAVVTAALAIPLAVAASRVLLGVHYLSDVVAGLFLGAGWTAMCAAVLVSWRQEETRNAASARGRPRRSRAGRGAP
ncbi:MAG: phosphatase PAP2 family protein [Mycobacteriales bacterium]|nr:phosphatase PAP2 family protein [Mycobacteriales bacterium]